VQAGCDTESPDLPRWLSAANVKCSIRHGNKATRDAACPIAALGDGWHCAIGPYPRSVRTISNRTEELDAAATKGHECSNERGLGRQLDQVVPRWHIGNTFAVDQHYAVAGISCTPCRPHNRKISNFRLQNAIINILPRIWHLHAGVLVPECDKEVLLHGLKDGAINGLTAMAALQNAKEGMDVRPSASTIIQEESE